LLRGSFLQTFSSLTIATIYESNGIAQNIYARVKLFTPHNHCFAVAVIIGVDKKNIGDIYIGILPDF
jgi:hypothetical protein